MRTGSYGYDILGRLTQKTEKDTTLDYIYPEGSYQPGSVSVNGVSMDRALLYDAAGNLWMDNHKHVTYKINALGLPERVAVYDGPVPATVDLSGAEVELVEYEDRTHRLDRAIEAAATGGWDVCLIDCPPSLGLLTINALIAANSILVPLQAEFFALEGLSQLLQTVERVQQRFNPDLGIIGVALTMFDRRNRLTDQVSDDVRSCLGNLVFEAVIPRNVRLSEAPSHGLPALVYDHACAGSRAYMALARELISRLPAQRKAA